MAAAGGRRLPASASTGMHTAPMPVLPRTAQQSVRMPLSATCRLFCRAAAFLESWRSTAAYAASRMPICEGLRRVERAESRRPSPAIPLRRRAAAYLPAARGRGGGGKVERRRRCSRAAAPAALGVFAA